MNAFLEQQETKKNDNPLKMIHIRLETKKMLLNIRLHPRESYDNVIQRLLKEYLASPPDA